MPKWIATALLLMLFNQNHAEEEYVKLYREFCNVVSTGSVQHPPIAKNAANPKFRNYCVNAKKLRKKIITIRKIKQPFQSKSEELLWSIASNVYVIIWARATSMEKTEDYNVNSDSQDVGFADWPTIDETFDFVDKICEQYHYIDNPKRQELKTKLRKIATEYWQVVDERPCLYQGRYVNGYIANGLYTVSSGVFKEYTEKARFPSLEFRIITTNMFLFSQISSDSMFPWLHAKWQLQVQLVSFAGKYLLENK